MTAAPARGPGRAVLVTGTDTGVGKTVAACSLLLALRARGVDAVGMKPFETGWAGHDWPEDAADLRWAAQAQEGPEDLVPFALRDPLAPAVAARREGRDVDVARAAAALDRLRSRHELVVVEGAGGLAVPVAGTTLLSDAAAAWRLPAVVVARPGLGTINHTTLTVEHARARGLDVLGVVVNRMPAVPDLAMRTNLEWLPRLAAARLLAVLPEQAGPTRAAAQALAGHWQDAALACVLGQPPPGGA